MQSRAEAAPLAIASHSHGGQIRVPGPPSWSWIGILAKGKPHVDGWIEGGYSHAGNRLYEPWERL